MLVEKIDNHIEKAYFRLVEQDKESNNIINFQKVFVGKWQELENLVWDIHDERNVQNAKYKSLDYLGHIVDEPRSYREDEEYRKAIINKIVQNNSCGSPEEIIFFVSFFISDINKIHLVEIYHNAFFVHIQADLKIDQVKLIHKVILVSKPVCVKFIGLIVTPTNEPIVFNEMTDINYDYAVGQSGVLLDTNYHNVENTLEVINYRGINASLSGLSDWTSATEFTNNGNFSELME